MARATGKRAVAAALFLVGGLSIIGIPILWPVAYLVWRSAKQQEREREQELAALE